MHFGNVPVFSSPLHTIGQLLPPDRPDIAFAGRSNGASRALINRLVNCTGLATPAANRQDPEPQLLSPRRILYLVDLARLRLCLGVAADPPRLGELISRYVETWPCLACVVVIMDLASAS